MTITIDLPPDIEMPLRARAGLAGQDLNEWILTLARREALRPLHKTMTAEEFDQIAEDLADTVSPSVPALSDEAMSRASIYKDHY